MKESALRPPSSTLFPVRPAVPVQLVAALVAVAGLFAAALVAAKDTPSAREIFDRHVAAVGGKKVLLRHDTVHYQGTFSVQGLSGPFDLYRGGGRVLFRVELPNLGALAQGYDGKVGWAVGQTGPQILEGEGLERITELADSRAVLRPSDAYRSLQSSGPVELEGEELYRVELTSHSGRVTTEYYDPKSGLRRATVSTQDTPAGRQEVTVLYSDYQEFDGVKVATRIVQKVAGQESVRTVESVSYDPIADSVFELPESIRGLLAER